MSGRKGFMKAYNQMPKPNSKHQKAKAENARKFTRVVCESCGIGDKPLYNVGGKYYCKEHIPS